MDAKTALTEVGDTISDAQSLIETLEPGDGGNRLDQYRYDEALRVLDKFVETARAVVADEREIRSFNVAQDHVVNIEALARILGETLPELDV